MKKAKNTFAILAIIVSVLAAVLLVCYPIVDLLAAKLGKEAYDLGAKFGPLVIDDLLKTRVPAVFDFGTIFGNIGENLIPFIALCVGGVGVLLLLVLLVLIIVKKHAKSLGWWFPILILLALAVITAGAIGVKPGLHTEEACNAGLVVYKGTGYFILGALIAEGVAAAFFILALVFYLCYIGKIKKASEGDSIVAAEAGPEEAAPVAQEAAPEVAVAVPAEEPAPAPAPAVAAPAEEGNPKAIRHILVHRSGRIVRVLNEHYYDVTTNIYVADPYADKELLAETEQEHYEKIIKVTQETIPSPEPAPMPAPAPVPTPVQVVVQPTPVVVAPAPAPAPVVVQAPAPAPVVAAPVAAPVKEKVERIPFANRMKHADKALKSAYNEIKSEMLSYGLKSRISIAGDTFRLHTKTYVMLVVAGKSLKLYFALDPKDYKDSKMPLGDASKKVLHKDTPLVFKVKSDLSVRRCKQLIADCCAKDGLEKGEFVKHDHVKDLKS